MQKMTNWYATIGGKAYSWGYKAIGRDYPSKAGKAGKWQTVDVISGEVVNANASQSRELNKIVAEGCGNLRILPVPAVPVTD